MNAAAYVPTILKLDLMTHARFRVVREVDRSDAHGCLKVERLDEATHVWGLPTWVSALDCDKEFVKRVTRIVYPAMPAGASDHDRETVAWSAEEAWANGLTVADAALYCYTFEEVSPDLPEEVAFERRARLREAYAGKARVKNAKAL